LASVKSFREGTKVLIVRRGGNKDGRFLEVAAYGMGGRRGFLLILDGRGWWGWHKFASELRKAKDFLFATIGCGFGSSSLAEKRAGNGFELHGTFICGGGEVGLVP